METLLSTEFTYLIIIISDPRLTPVLCVIHFEKKFSYCLKKKWQLGMFLGIEHHFDKGPYLDGKEQSDEKINPMVCFIKRRVP